MRLSSQEEGTFLVQKASVYACFLQLKPEKFQRLEASRTLDARGVYCSLPGMLRAYCALLHALVGAYTWCGFLFVLIEIKGFLRTSVVQ